MLNAVIFCKAVASKRPVHVFRRGIYLLFLFICGLTNSFAPAPAAGTIDSTLTTLPSTDDGANVIAVVSDDKLLIGGSFRNYGGVGRLSIVRLNADGALDASFNIGSGPTLTSGSTRVTNNVARILIGTDGKILAAAKMDKWNEQPAANVVLLNDDGSQDLSFAPVFASNASVSYFVDIDGDQILMAGEPGAYAGKAPIFRVRSTGAIDPTFQGMSLASLGFTSASVRLFAVQPDGKIVAQLTGVNGSTIGYRIVRMNADGSFDASYANGGATLSREAYVMRAQADGKMLIGTLVGIGYNGIAQGTLFRLNTDGSLDGTFDVSTSGLGQVTAILPQADGHILVAAGSNREAIEGRWTP